MATTSKYYVVWVGRNDGVFNNWEDARLAVEGYAGAKYKAFDNYAAAHEAYAAGWAAYLNRPKPKTNPLF